MQTQTVRDIGTSPPAHLCTVNICISIVRTVSTHPYLTPLAQHRRRQPKRSELIFPSRYRQVDSSSRASGTQPHASKAFFRLAFFWKLWWSRSGRYPDITGEFLLLSLVRCQNG